MNDQKDSRSLLPIWIDVDMAQRVRILEEENESLKRELQQLRVQRTWKYWLKLHLPGPILNMALKVKRGLSVGRG